MGYRDPPHGLELAENMSYNIYFPGCQIAMPAPLAAGMSCTRLFILNFSFSPLFTTVTT
jgi:cytochrome c1